MALIILFLVIVWGLAATTKSTQEAPMCGNGDAYPGLNTHFSFTKKPVDDVIFTEAVLSEEAARSKIDCGRKCVRAQGCVMYTFQPIQGVSSSRCRLYRQFHNLEDDKQTKPGARSYAMDMTGDPRSSGKGYSLVSGRCILVLNETMTYMDARRRCRELSQGHLLFTKNTADISFGVRILDEYEIDIQTTLDKCREKDITILIGNFNAKIGGDNTAYGEVMGTHGLGEMSENGERFTDNCALNKLVIGGSVFPHKRIYIGHIWVGADDKQMEGHFVWADGTPLVNPSFLKRAKKRFACVCLLRLAKRLNSCSCRKLKQFYIVCQRGA